MEPLVHWSHEETRALIGVWSEEKIQRDLEESFRNETVYREMSGRLAARGISRSAKQCRAKIKKLKQEYRNTRRHGERSEAVTKTFRWFDAMDAIMGDRSARTQSRERPSSVVLEVMVPDASSPTITDTPESYTSSTHSLPLTLPRPAACPAGTPQVSSFYSVQFHEFDGPSTSNAVTSTAVQTSIKDTPLCCWSSKEVQALLTLWANPEVQQELLLNVRNNQVYTCLSSKLALLGFNKAPKKCREKIKKLKQEYKRIKNGQYRGGSSSVWFAIMDEVLSSQALVAKCSQTVQPSSAPRSLAVQSVALDVDADDETPWLPDEVQVLVTLWAQPNIQKQLLTAASHEVFTYLSSELSLVGFNKTPCQCSVKVNDLKEEYRKIKQMETQGAVKSDWFAILDSVFDDGGATSKEVDSCAVQKKPKSPECEHVDADKLRAVWTPDEVGVLLSRWAEESVQGQLRLNPRNERAFAELSSELATQGFDKTTSECRSKIALLTQKYRRIKAQEDPEKPKSRWFAIMDEVLSRSKAETETKAVRDSERASLQTSLQSLPDTAEAGCRLSVSSLCLLVPTLRLMCAFAWQVVQCCNVAQYRKVEELVKLVTEVAPELLTARERVQLLLRLRARLVLELCLSENTTNLLNIQPHLKVIRDLTLSCDQEDATELENSKSNFVEIVHAVLEDPEERQRFFKEVFSIYYGKQYDVTLQTLVWKFISRLDNLLPIPDIKQTAEWLSSAPSVTEECARIILEPDQLKALLNFHQQQSGNTNKRCSQADENMFLPKLSFNPKGNFQLVLAQRDEFSSNKDERQFDYSEAVEPAGGKAPVKDCGKEIEDLKFKHEQSDDMAPSYCSDLNCTPLGLQTCSLCPYSDSHVSGLLKHIREEHLIQESTHPPITDPSKDCAFQRVKDQTYTPKIRRITDTCEYCGKVFKGVSALTSHIKTHTLPFHCDKCDKKYSSKWSLTVHRRIHTGETPYLCSYCGQGFRSSNILTLHVRIHTGDRRYKCPICGKTSIQHLSRHMRMHRGEKNYLCTECGKAFLSSGELRLHMRFHTGERPYTCKHCGKGFIAKCLLTVHTRQHTGESPYRCSLCPKSFRTLRAQKRHLVIHSSKRSFQCLECGKICRQEEAFKRHSETHK